MLKFDFYFKPECPFCMKVMNFMLDNSIINYRSFNIADGTAGKENKKKLEELGGKVQVPFIVTKDGEGMYESDDIIEYLKENLDYYKDSHKDYIEK